MKIEAGKYYKTRDGRKVGPTEVSEYNIAYPKAKFWVEGYGLIQENGKFGNDDSSKNLDLISEWQDSPIRTVKRREIVAGNYGAVAITKSNKVMIPAGDYTAEELREAAHLLNQIAEVLGENGK